MSKHFPQSYFGVKLYTTKPPFTGPDMSAFLLGGCAKYLSLALPDLLSSLYLVLCPKRLADMGHLCPLVDLAIGAHQWEIRRREESSGHWLPGLPLCIISMNLNKGCCSSQETFSTQPSFPLSDFSVFFFSLGFQNHSSPFPLQMTLFLALE